MVDSEMTPYVLVNARAADVAVPGEYVNDGKIVLNVAPHAVSGLAMDETALTCQCRFGGRPFAIYLPMLAIEAIYARETGEGMAFEPEHPTPPENPPGGSDTPPGPGRLKVVK